MSAYAMRLSTARRYGVVFAVLMGLTLCLALPSAAWAETARGAMQAGDPAAGLSTQTATVTKKVSMKVGDTKKMSASGLKVKKATWKSSKKKVATVKKGKVKAVKAGKATITAKQGKKTFKFKVTVKDPAKTEYNRACKLYDEGKFYSAKVAFENSKYKDWEERAAACVQPMPETGELYRNDNMRSDNMRLQFVVGSSDESVGRYITVYSKDSEIAAALFIKGAGSLEMWLLPGEYYVKDSEGTEWYGEDEQFGPDGHYENMVFNEVEGDPNLTSLEAGYAYTITINPSAGNGRGVDSEDTSWEDRS